MIRYVAAVVLMVSIMAIAMPAVDHAAGTNGEKQLLRAVSEVDDAATDLYRAEELPPPGGEGPRRVVEVRFPEDSLTSNPVVTLRIRRIDENSSLVTYRVEGRAKGTYHVSAPVVNADGNPVVLGGTGERRFVLTLERDSEGRPVVVLERL